MPALRREIAALAALAGASLLAAWALPRPSAPGLVGRFWDNPSWSGAPAAEVSGSLPSTSHLVRRLPALRGGSAEWTGFLLVDDGGVHEFAVTSDDGAWLYLDERLVIDNGGEHASETATARIHLASGPHAMRVRYFQAAGRMQLHVTWTPPDGRRRMVELNDVVPSDALAGLQRWLPLVRTLSVAVPVVWACLFLYLPVRLAASWLWREVRRAAPRPEDRRALGAVLLAAFGLMIWGLDWGIAGDGWAADELGPGQVREVIERRFADGWHDKYPMMHYVIMAIPVSAFEIAERIDLVDADGLPAHVAATAMIRLVSLLMGLGTLITAFLCGAELYGGRRAVWAPLVLLVTPLFVYYGKVANLDVPMMFWFGLAILAFLRILKAHRLPDYAVLGAAAAAAVATKDQAYANLALMPLVVVFANARVQSSPLWRRRIAAALVDRRVWTAGGAAAVAFAVLQNLPFNFDGVVAHFRLLATLGDLAIVPRNAAGYAELTATTVGLFRFALGWPLFVAAVIAVAVAVVDPARRWWLWLLVVPLSFHLTFTWVTLYVCDRYLFGGIFVLSLFAGSAFAELVEAERWRAVVRTAIAASLGYSLAAAASINVMMTLDARYAARRWLEARAVDGARVALIGSYLPALGHPIDAVFLPASIGAVEEARPDLVVLNARFAWRYRAESNPDGRDLLDALADGSLGYVEAFRYRASLPAWALLQYNPEFQRPEESVLTNLDKINPEMVIYQRRE